MNPSNSLDLVSVVVITAVGFFGMGAACALACWVVWQNHLINDLLAEDGDDGDDGEDDPESRPLIPINSEARR